MKKISTILLLLIANVMMMMAQTPGGRSATVTMFKDFKPATIVLGNGKINQVRYGNIFLKNSTLVYKQSAASPVMEANMSVVKHLVIDKRTFLNVDNQLAEVLDTVGENYLVRVSTVDVETMKAEYMNESNYTNFDMGEVFSFTRSDVADKEEPYPLLDKYYFIIKGKKVLAHERNVRNTLKRKTLEEYDAMISLGFKWSDPTDLRRLLRFLASCDEKSFK